MNIRQLLILLIALTFAALGSMGAFAVFQSKDNTIEVRSVTEGVMPSALASVELMSQLKDVQIATLAMVFAKEQSEVTQTLGVLAAAFRVTPNRFKGVRPCLAPMPTAVWINPPKPEVQTNTQHCTVNLRRRV